MKKYIFFNYFLFLGTLLQANNQKPIIISLGYRCQVAVQLRAHGLRYAAFPFDWVITPFDGLCNLIENDFNDFLNPEFLKFRDGPYALEHNHFQYTSYKAIENVKYKILFLHDFGRDETFMIHYQTVKAKYNRRIKRFYKALNSGQHIFFIRRITTKKQALQLRDLLCKKFPGLSFTLITLDHTDEIKNNWHIPDVINLFLPLPIPLHRDGDYHAWTKVFEKTGFGGNIIHVDPSEWQNIYGRTQEIGL